jgi:hypothetical protein
LVVEVSQIIALGLRPITHCGLYAGHHGKHNSNDIPEQCLEINTIFDEKRKIP